MIKNTITCKITAEIADDVPGCKIGKMNAD